MVDVVVDCKDCIYKIREKTSIHLNDIESKQMDHITGFPSPYGATTYIYISASSSVLSGIASTGMG